MFRRVLCAFVFILAGCKTSEHEVMNDGSSMSRAVGIPISNAVGLGVLSKVGNDIDGLSAKDKNPQPVAFKTEAETRAEDRARYLQSTGGSSNCELKNPNGGTCSQQDGSSTTNENSGLGFGQIMAGVMGAGAIVATADGNFSGASALLQAAAPLASSDVSQNSSAPGSSGDTSMCKSAPRCRMAKEKLDAQLSSWSQELGGRGVATQYGYAYCAAIATANAAGICEQEASSNGQQACAQAAADARNNANNVADQAIQNARDVGANARTTGPCG